MKTKALWNLVNTKEATLDAWIAIRLAMDDNRKHYGGSDAQKAKALALRSELIAVYGMTPEDLATILAEERNIRG